MLFFGDSITAGEGAFAKVNFTDFFKRDALNLGVSGTTIGRYSPYPTDDYCLLNMVQRHKKEIKEHNIIFLEYGINDTTAIMCGMASFECVIVSVIKAVDYIKQINPECEVYFLRFSDKPEIEKKLAEVQCEYLKNVYFKDFDFNNFPASVWLKYYSDLILKISKMLPVFPMLSDVKWEDIISEDGLHPNITGHAFIYENIISYLSQQHKF